MICQRCRTHLLSRLQFQQHVVASPSSCARLSPLVRSQVRLYSDNAPMPPPPTPRQPPTASKPVIIPSATPSATPSASQPPSTPEEGKPSAKPEKSEKPAKPAVERPPSSCAAGTKLQGLNYMKNKPDIYAMEDSEYPDWLWTLLDDSKKQSSSETGGVDPSSKDILIVLHWPSILTPYSHDQEATQAV